MEYAARLPSTRSMLVPVMALAIGAAGAVGVYAAVDDAGTGAETAAQATRVIVADPPAAPGEGVAQKHEAATAAAIAGAGPLSSSEPKDEANIAAAVGTAEAHKGGGPPAEDDSGTANRTDPHGPAAVTP